MLKQERLTKILQMVNDKGIVDTADIMEALAVSDMTVRRDLDELEKAGKLIRVGAEPSPWTTTSTSNSLTCRNPRCRSRKTRHCPLCSAGGAGSRNHFSGPGHHAGNDGHAAAGPGCRVVTPSLPAFEALKDKLQDRVVLVGGTYRSNTGTFAGTLTNQILRDLKFTKAFISCNGIADDELTTSSLEEGEMQAIACRNARNVYLLADSRKFNREDFYVYEHLYNIDELITDSTLSQDVADHYREYTRIRQVKVKNEEEK